MVIKSRKPEYLFNKLEWVQLGHMTTRELLLSPTDKTITWLFRGSFRYAVTKCWNSTPLPFRKIGLSVSFKTKSTYFFFAN